MSRIAVGLALILSGVAAAAPAQRASESAAFNRSLLGTVVPIGLGWVMAAATYNDSWGADNTAAALGGLTVTGGLLVGPALGYFYSGQSGRAWRGIGLRLLGFGTMIGAAAASWDCYGGECSTAGAVALAGSAITLGSAIYDIARVQGSVRRRNAAAPGASLAVAPTYSARRHTVGLAGRVSF